ncbi:MAG TPA: hypothetical protein VHB48_10060 [Chitinophagaceae bacterium]|nr:hypothetical protein [Chitinophagaceae bacterium]
MMSSEKGEFDIASQYVNANVLLSAVGYLHQSCRLVAGQTNVFRLKPNSNLLPGVTVAAKIEKNADRIIKRVNKNMEKNYGSPSFDQTFNIYTLTRNYDTLKGEVTHLLRRHYFGDQTSTLAKTWMLRSDTANYDADFLNLIGVPELFLEMIADRYDIIRKGVIIGKTRSENFNFKLLGHYQDEIYGPVYRISFKPRSPYYALFWGINTHTSFGYFIGEMLVSKNDYAVVNMKYTLERDVADIRKGVEDLYHSRNWKADRVSKIVPKSLTFNDEYSYIKDTVTGKYFVKTINLDCFETGHQVENNRNVQLYFKIDINSLGIENVGAGTN